MRAYLGIDIEYIDLNLKSELHKVKSQHLTLFFWNDLSEKEAKRISQSLRVFQHKSFTAKVSKIIAIPNKIKPEIITLDLNSVEELFKIKEEVLSHLGLVPSEEFQPHITLYRKEKLDNLFKDSKELLKEIIPIKILISNVALYSSNPEKGLNEYKLLEKRFLF